MKTTTTRAFTLIETIVVIGLFVAGFATVVFMYDSFTKVFQLGSATSATTMSARDALLEVEKMVLPASSVLATYAFSSGTYTSATTSLVLEMPAIDTNGSALIGKYDRAAFYVQNGKGYRVLSADASSSRRSGVRQVSDATTTFSFTYDTADKTQATAVTSMVTVTQTIKQSSIDTVASSTVYLRNHN